MTYSSDFLLFYVYAVTVFAALVVSVLTLTAEAASDTLRQWRLKRLSAERGQRERDAVARSS